MTCGSKCQTRLLQDLYARLNFLCFFRIASGLAKDIRRTWRFFLSQPQFVWWWVGVLAFAAVDFFSEKNLAQNAWGTETVWAPMMMRSSSLRNWVTWQESTWRWVVMCWVSSEVSKWLRRVQSHGPTKSRNILAKRDADYWLPQHCDSTSLLTCQSIVIWFFKVTSRSLSRGGLTLECFPGFCFEVLLSIHARAGLELQLVDLKDQWFWILVLAGWGDQSCTKGCGGGGWRYQPL